MDFEKEYFYLVENNIDIALSLYEKYKEHFGEFDHNNIQVYHDYKYRILNIATDTGTKEKREQYCRTLEKQICSAVFSRIRSLSDLGYI